LKSEGSGCAVSLISGSGKGVLAANSSCWVDPVIKKFKAKPKPARAVALKHCVNGRAVFWIL
jgi:hypothetical protein